MKVWMDVDGGVDDAQAMLLVLSHPDVEVVGISCVSGNVLSDQVAINVARVLQLAGRTDVPFYIGSITPLIGPSELDGTEFHGDDGLGDVGDAIPMLKNLTAQPQEENGIIKLVDYVINNPGELHLICLGPLTNIALACRVESRRFPSRVASITVFGGAVEGRGNTGINCVSEFNFMVDPESAHIVLESFEEVTLVSWDCAVEHAVPWEWYTKWVAKDTAKARFMQAVSLKSVEECKKMDIAWAPCDTLAAAIALQPALIASSLKAYVGVELTGSLTRGQSVLDRRATLDKPPNVVLVTLVDKVRFLEMMDLSLED
eukprot:jgi/Mesvir1/3897/Mv19843-RA.1